MAEKKLNMKEAEASAKEKATRQVITMFQRPGQIEKIEQYKRRVARQKASFEALSKSASQKQIDGVRKALTMLKKCSETVKEINGSVQGLNKLFDVVPVLYNSLNEVRDENMRHSQYVTAIENHKHIFTMPASVEKTKQWINEAKLLHTHQSLRDLETSRDDLLFELHKLPNQSVHDKSMLKAYFSEVEVLSQLLEKQMRIILSRTLNTVRKDPSIIVTVLRIIKREEEFDQDSVKREKQTGFISPGRPKKWKKMLFEILEKSVATRIEGTQVDERDDNKLWLIRYLELIRLLIVEDLRVVKHLCVPCFPPEYEIMKKYIDMYHNSLSRHLQEIIQNGLEGNEYVTILSWINQTYKSRDLLGHPDLSEDTKNLGPLLPKAVVDRLEKDYLTNIDRNYGEWMQNTLTSEMNEWSSVEELNLDSYSRQPAPLIIFQMIDQNLQVTKTMRVELTLSVLSLSIDHLIKFSESYKTSIIDFKNRYFADRKQVPYFTQNMILIINNCHQFIKLGSELEKHYSENLDITDVPEKIRSMERHFLDLRNESCAYLLQEVSTDLEEYYNELFTPNWLKTQDAAIDTIHLTLVDYFKDYQHLVDENYKYIAETAKNTVAKRYLTCLLSKRLTVKTFEECRRVADKIKHETNKLSQLFVNLCKITDEKDNPFKCIFMLCEIISSDGDMVSFELHRAVEQYPDISEDHLLRLLNFRGDIPRADIKDKIQAVEKPKGHYRSTIFSTIVFQKQIISF
ncbi:unnamed protein product [Brassicogethes aeneus]|uniref:Exocyst complex component 3 n=1 Tax=Brassicogethes aeneus TaxID=1431903 RepID=A0A9P0BFN1_BRAAE|nr:unnamed protein product [Brassicogethes aeneus]